MISLQTASILNHFDLLINCLTLFQTLLLISCQHYPNPWYYPKDCGRQSYPSYICDPDHILSIREAAELDKLLFEKIKNSVCICEQCAPGKRGLIIGIALTLNKWINNSNNQMFADDLRSKWDLDYCENDVIILLNANDSKIMTSFGIASLEVLKNAQIDKFIQRLENDLKEKLYFEILKKVVNKITSVNYVNVTKYTIKNQEDWSNFELDPSKKDSQTDNNKIPSTSSFAPILKTTSKDLNNLIKESDLEDETSISAQITTKTVILFMITFVLLVLLIVLALITWYCRTKTNDVSPKILH